MEFAINHKPQGEFQLIISDAGSPHLGIAQKESLLQISAIDLFFKET